MLFGCVVSGKAWRMISDVLGIKMGKNYESIAKLWLCNKRYGVTNIVTSALCWSVWKLRNILCFQGACYTRFLRPKPDAHRMYAQDQVVIHTVRM
jgi:hypothetical protein